METEDNIQHKEAVDEINKTNFLTSVTPLSKYLAMILFIAMPFIGGYVGYKYAPEITGEAKKVAVEEEENVDPQSFLSQKIECQKVGELEHTERLQSMDEEMRTSNMRVFVSSGPEYTYNTELDTCLYYLGVTSNLLERGKTVYNSSNTDYQLLLIVNDLLSGENILFFGGEASNSQNQEAFVEFERKKRALFNN